MRKNPFFTKKGFMGLFALLMLVIGGATLANAAGETPGVAANSDIKLDVPVALNYEMPSQTFIPTVDGICTVTSNSTQNLLMAGGNFIYTDAAHTVGFQGISHNEPGNNEPYIYTFPVEANQTYYVWVDAFAFDNVTLTFSLQEGAVATPVTVTNIYPAPGGAFDAKTYENEITVIFDPAQVDVNGARGFVQYMDRMTQELVKVELTNWVDGGNNDREPVYYAGNSVRVNLTSVLDQVMANGVEEVGMNVILEGVTYAGAPVTGTTLNSTDVTVEDGTVTMHYTLETGPQLDSAVWPGTFYNYWEEGNSDGIAVLTFDKPIQTINKVMLVMGTHVWGSEGGETNDPNWELTPTIEGNVVKIDFTGVERSESGYNNVTVFVQWVEGQNGIAVNFGEGAVLTQYMTYVDEPFSGETGGGGDQPTEGPGNVGNIELNKVYNVTTDLTGTFTPTADGTLTATYSEDGSQLAMYVWNSVIYTDADYSNEVECIAPDGGIQTYNLKAGTTYYVRANVADMLGTLGFPFGVEFTYAENGGGDEPTGEYKIVDIIPAPGAIAGFMEGSQVKIKFNQDPPAFLFELFNGLDNEIWTAWYSTQGQWTLDEDGYYVHDVGIDFNFYEGLTYEGIVTFYSAATIDPSYEVNKQTVTWTGAGESPASQVTVSSITPPTDQVLNLNEDGSATVVVSFTGPVTVTAEVPEGQGFGTPVNATPNDDETVWTVNVPASVVNTCVSNYEVLKVTIFANDGVGKDVYYDNLPYIGLEWTTNAEIVKGKDFQVSLADATVAAPVTSFTVSASQAINANDTFDALEGMNPYTSITVAGVNNDFMTTVKSLDGEEFTGVVTLEEAITAPGEYTITFPYNAFVIGEEMSSEGSMAKTVNFTVEGGDLPSVPNPWFAQPWGVQEMLYGILVVWGDYEPLSMLDSSKQVTLTDPSGYSKDFSCTIDSNAPGEEGGGDPTGEPYPNSLRVQKVYKGTDPFADDAIYSEEGTYTFFIPAGLVSVNGTPNPATTMKFQLGKSKLMSYGEVTFPEGGIYQSYLGEIMVSYGEYIEMATDDEVYGTLTIDGGEPIEVPLSVYEVPVFDDPDAPMPWNARAAEEGMEYVLWADFFDLVDWGDFGTYVISIPEGVVKNAEGLVNPAQEFTFYVMDCDYSLPTITPEPGEYKKDELSKVTISWDNQSLTYNYTADNVFVEDQNNDKTYLPFGQEVTLNADATALEVNLSELEAGKYAIVVPDYYVIINDELLNGLVYSDEYVILDQSGVVAFNADEDGMYRVYNLNGINVLNTTDVEAVRQLDGGVYIVNGVKVLIRK